MCKPVTIKEKNLKNEIETRQGSLPSYWQAPSIKEKNLKNEIETWQSSMIRSPSCSDQREESQEWDWNCYQEVLNDGNVVFTIKEKNLKNEIETLCFGVGTNAFLGDQREESQEWDWNHATNLSVISINSNDQREESQEWDWNAHLIQHISLSCQSIKEKNLKNEIETGLTGTTTR